MKSKGDVAGSDSERVLWQKGKEVLLSCVGRSVSFNFVVAVWDEGLSLIVFATVFVWIVRR